MSKAAFKIIAEDSPMALSKLFSNIARRLVAAWDARMRSTPSAAVAGAGAGAGLAAAAGPGPSLGVLGGLPSGGVAGHAGAQRCSGSWRGALLPFCPSERSAHAFVVCAGAKLDLVGSAAVAASSYYSPRSDIVTITIVPAGVMAQLSAPQAAGLRGTAAMRNQAPGGCAPLVRRRLSADS